MDRENAIRFLSTLQPDEILEIANEALKDVDYTPPPKKQVVIGTKLIITGYSNLSLAVKAFRKLAELGSFYSEVISTRNIFQRKICSNLFGKRIFG